jgi:hypothetical protein
MLLLIWYKGRNKGSWVKFFSKLPSHSIYKEANRMVWFMHLKRVWIGLLENPTPKADVKEKIIDLTFAF